MVAAARAGDEGAFGVLFERYRGELRVHCYRMLGSFDEAEDLVQETFLRAWKNLDGFQARSTFRAWAYRIATNACLDFLDSRARRVLPYDLSAPTPPGPALPPRTDIPWLQPFPDRLAEPAAPSESRPDSVAVARETIELAFLAALQHLPPRQRAALILQDVLGWPARQTAALLESPVASVNSALQRARTTLREHLPERRADWANRPSGQERTVLRRYVDAMQRADLDALARLLAEEVRTAMPPWPMWLHGRDSVVAALTASWDSGYVGRLRMVPTGANRQPAVATYVQRTDAYHPFAISVLEIEDDRVTEITAFHDLGLFPAFGLPATLTDDFPDDPPSQHESTRDGGRS
ncbi:RNA polymerase sigma-70 factor (ECF subfamily) [Actinophytocola oryzae]|uniref:RNA polymerase sigma-70 factor (ECF subfamily) n=1 Tax=Actinophytocola oryzae TaxID=502181 RepID=A0A4R7VFR0_9PSEU|nr:RNA polymerase sigma-70 factor (ECF subfamily) [Actinophytocola oryzae]